ncbi:MAG: biotin-dependent carboxyltransferase family protein, partial [Anaerolineae bacterium]|nr:biotin-dependent carboxyltransferase family protein [Anaerolineae bacterium]
VLEPGTLTTVQDAGRVGWGRYGIPPSGPMDATAFVAANRLVGNPPGAAALEITLTGPVLRAWRDCLIAVCGAEFELWAGNLTAPTNHAVYVRAGYTLRFGRRLNGARAYLAVDGGIDVPPYLGSRSTYLKGGFGGLEGRALRAGDQLPLGFGARSHPISGAGARWLAPVRKATSGAPTVRVVLGPQEDYFSAKTIDRFLGCRYEVTTAADRMGIRLMGARLDHAGETGIVSDGIVTGSIQIPPDGQPIAMMVDHQTTGGYPKIATVIQADLPLLAQRLPGDEVRLAQVTLDEARAAYRQYIKSQES